MKMNCISDSGTQNVHWYRKPESPEKVTDMPHVTDQLLSDKVVSLPSSLWMVLNAHI